MNDSPPTRIFVVDDSRTTAPCTPNICRTRYEVQQASDGIAIRRARLQAMPDLIVMDSSLPSWTVGGDPLLKADPTRHYQSSP